jgi:FMN phosphatase YigB (HAD superfamily)
MIKGVLFDAGGVLTRPVGGRWNPRYDFEGIVRAHCPGVPEDLFVPAIAAGQRFLDDSPATANRTEYHRVMLTVLGVADPSSRLLAELEGPAAGPVVELYPDVRPVLDRLWRWRIGMSVVSDNWGGMAAGFDEAGIGRYFAGYAISELLGCRKPDPRMYAEGSRLLGLPPPECLFIDDDPDLVAAAVGLGYRGVTLDRDAPHGRADEVITSLDDLLPIVDRLRGRLRGRQRGRQRG